MGGGDGDREWVAWRDCSWCREEAVAVQGVDSKGAPVWWGGGY